MNDEHNEEKNDHSDDEAREAEDEAEEVQYDNDGGEERVEDRIKRLRDKLKRSEKEREENLTGWQRAKADFVNLKRRETSARAEAREGAIEEIVSRIFPLLDSFEAAFGSDSWKNAEEDFKTGIESIHKQFLSVLVEFDVEPIGEQGEAFDPHIYTSVSTQETNDKAKDDTVAEVLQKGYRYHDRVLRSPKVVVFNYQE